MIDSIAKQRRIASNRKKSKFSMKNVKPKVMSRRIMVKKSKKKKKSPVDEVGFLSNLASISKYSGKY